MTNEQAIKWLKDYIQNTPFQMEQYERAFDMAIKALEQNESAEEWYKLFVKKLDEQEPCDDAISRQAVINAIENDCMKGGLGSCFACYNDAQAFRGEIEKLPSVTQKSGKWVRYKDNCLYNQCSYCGASHCREDDFCPNCGAKMESEVQE